MTARPCCSSAPPGSATSVGAKSAAALKPSPALRPVFTLAIALVIALVQGLYATARSDVVAVVSVKSAITMLSKTQVTDIFLGKVTRFPSGAEATPVDQAASLIREQFYVMVADRSPAQIKAYWSKIIFTGRGRPPQAVLDSTQMKKTLAANPGAIGYLDSRDVDASVRVLF